MTDTVESKTKVSGTVTVADTPTLEEAMAQQILNDFAPGGRAEDKDKADAEN